jgi:hypothetical protein
VNWSRARNGPIEQGYRVAAFNSQDFIDAFGQPAKTKTQGQFTYWVWNCRDGAVSVIQVTTSHPESVEFLGVDDM